MTRAQTAPLDALQRAQIADFFMDYAHTIDDADVRAWPSYFCEDGRYQIITRESYEAGWPIGIMLCTSRAMMEDRMLALETANVFEPHSYCHILGPHRISQSAQDTGSDSYDVRTNFSIVRTMQEGRMEQFAAGKYVDRLTLASGQPMLQSRTVVLDPKRVDILIVYPL
jgi:anthranilate 1,2-dioxygenase small subunit